MVLIKNIIKLINLFIIFLTLQNKPYSITFENETKNDLAVFIWCNDTDNAILDTATKITDLLGQITQNEGLKSISEIKEIIEDTVQFNNPEKTINSVNSILKKFNKIINKKGSKKKANYDLEEIEQYFNKLNNSIINIERSNYLKIGFLQKKDNLKSANNPTITLTCDTADLIQTPMISIIGSDNPEGFCNYSKSWTYGGAIDHTLIIKGFSPKIDGRLHPTFQKNLKPIMQEKGSNTNHILDQWGACSILK